MSVQQPLRALLKQLSPTIEIIGPDEVPSDFDYHCPLLSLPLAFRTTLETIPAQQQYLKADEKLRTAWAARLPPKTKPRIGLVWSGTTVHKNDHNRSIELARFLPILSPDADWISLQKEIREKDLAVLRQSGRIAFLGDDLKDFSDTAALLDLMDLVITVDTSCSASRRRHGQAGMDIVALSIPIGDGCWIATTAPGIRAPGCSGSSRSATGPRSSIG